MGLNLWAYAAVTALAGGAIAGVWWHGYASGTDACEDEIREVTEDARREAREIEKEQQRATDDAVRKQAEALGAVNDRLAAQLERLRDRPLRASVSRDPDVECAGASGAELAREHAAFLTRYAALAARKDAALRACYEYADSLQ